MPFRYSSEFRRQVCERMLAGEAVKELAAELSVTDTTLYKWRRQALIDAGQSPGRQELRGRPLAQARRRIKELEAELKLVKAASALFDEGGARQPKRKYQVVRGTEQPGLLRTRRPVGSSGSRARRYYDIKFHQPGYREIRHLLLADLIADIHTRSRGTYGMLRIRAALEIEQGIIVNKKLMLEDHAPAGHQGPARARRSARRTSANEATEEDLVKRNFTVDAPQRAVAHRHHRAPDPRGQGLLLRRPRPLQPQGRRLGHRPTLRVRAGQRRACPWRRGRGSPRPRRSSTRTTAVSSPRGPSPRTSDALGLLGSMGTIGDCYDNAPMESFWGSMQIELLNRKKWRTDDRALDRHGRVDRALLQPDRRHSALDYLTPIEYEALHSTKTQAAFS